MHCVPLCHLQCVGNKVVLHRRVNLNDVTTLPTDIQVVNLPLGTIWPFADGKSVRPGKVKTAVCGSVQK